jgi:GNAT superfamily N-acetyltransferase
VSFRIRPATGADLPELLALYRELHPADPPLALPDAGKIWQTMVAQPGRSVLVAVDDTALLGTVDCTVLANLTRGGAPFMLVENVVVAAAARRRGIGGALMAAAADLARSTGCYKIAKSRTGSTRHADTGRWRPDTGST